MGLINNDLLKTGYIDYSAISEKNDKKIKNEKLKDSFKIICEEANINGTGSFYGDTQYFSFMFINQLTKRKLRASFRVETNTYSEFDSEYRYIMDCVEEAKDFHELEYEIGPRKEWENIIEDYISDENSLEEISDEELFEIFKENLVVLYDELSDIPFVKARIDDNLNMCSFYEAIGSIFDGKFNEMDFSEDIKENMNELNGNMLTGKELHKILNEPGEWVSVEFDEMLDENDNEMDFSNFIDNDTDYYLLDSSVRHLKMNAKEWKREQEKQDPNNYEWDI